MYFETLHLHGNDNSAWNGQYAVNDSNSGFESQMIKVNEEHH